MSAGDVFGRVDDLAQGTGGSVDAVIGAAIGPYRETRVKSSAYRVRDAIWRRPTSASMVRVALPFVNGDVERAMATAEKFIGDLRPLLPRHLVQGRRAEPRERAR